MNVRPTRRYERRPVVIIVDDDPSILSALHARCVAMGIETRLYTDVSLALKMARMEAPDLMIVDVNMRLGSGLVACEALLHDDLISRPIPMIVMTGNSDRDTRQRVLRSGAAYVRKGAHLWDRLEPRICATLGVAPARRTA